MSFSSRTKEELCRSDIGSKSAALAEFLGVALYCNQLNRERMRIVTENPDFAERLPLLLKKALGITFDELPAGGEKLVFQVTDSAKLMAIRDAFGFDSCGDQVSHLNFNVIDDERCATAYLRGVFLSGGSVTDPGKRYHLELTTSHRAVARETCSLMLDMSMQPKETVRNGSAVLYFKQSDSIADFLTVIGAPVCAMEIIEARVEKELVNGINRRVNCETANLTKVADASHQQLAAIRRLREKGVFEDLPPKLRETAELRENNPEAALTELAELAEPPISKSAMNHRMRKLLELAEE